VIVGVRVQRFPDEAYVDGPDGANFAVPWLMNALDEAANSNAGALLCHQHSHRGKPDFSGTDQRTNDRVMAKQRLVNDGVPFGAMVVSLDDFRALVAAASGFDEFEVKLPIAFEGFEGP